MVICEPASNVIKRVFPQRRTKLKLDFTAPNELGKKTYMRLFMCDAYLGYDHEKRVHY